MNLDLFENIFNPTSVAVIGASNTAGKWGFNIFNRVLASGAGRKVYPVTSGDSDVIGVKAFSSIKEIPGPVDLAVITVPPQYVPDAINDCAQKQVRVVEIITAGFGEADEKGRGHYIFYDP